LWILFFKGQTTSDALVYTTLFLLCVIAFFIIVFDLIPRLFAQNYPESSFRISKRFTVPFLFLFSPLTFILYHLISLVVPKACVSPFGESTISSRERLLELIRDVDDGNLMNDHDKKLLSSVFSFRDRIVREVMVPRVNLFCLPHDMTIRNAAKQLQKEGY